MNTTIKDLIERRSIRKFKDKQIHKEDLELILKAGTYAPSGMNRQTNKIVVLQNKEKIANLEKLNASYTTNPEGNPFFGAPTLITVLSDSSSRNWVKDGSLVIGNLMNAAHALGIGSCWINRAQEIFDSEEGKEILKSWGIDQNYRGVGHVILGYPEGELPEAKPRKDDYIVYID